MKSMTYGTGCGLALLWLGLQQGSVTVQPGGAAGAGGASGLSPIPNVLVILADDLGVDHVDWHPVGAAIGNAAPTPVLSQLAQAGINFTQAYATPICGPTRACLLTGRLPFRHGVGENPGSGAPELQLSEFTLAEAFHAAGYQTACFGKWHVSLDRDDPNRQGFRHFDGTVAGLKGASYYSWPRVINGVGFTETGYATSVVTDSAIQWIQNQGKLRWFAYVAYSSPHKPFEPPPPALDPITQATVNDPEEVIYHGMIEALDHEIGRLVGTVDLARTLVLFFGDNGSAQSKAQAPILSNKAKYSIYEGGVLVPGFAVGATVGKSGDESGLVHLVDVFRTVLDAAEAPLTPGPIDSVSLLAPNLPPSMHWVPRRKFLFTERFSPSGSPPLGPFVELRRSIRDRTYKLIRTETGDEFYQLDVDPWETNDLLLAPLTVGQQASFDELEAKLDQLINS